MRVSRVLSIEPAVKNRKPMRRASLECGHQLVVPLEFRTLRLGGTVDCVLCPAHEPANLVNATNTVDLFETLGLLDLIIGNDSGE